MIKEDALSYIEKLIIQMLAMLCASQPHTVQEVTDRVQKKIPDPINAWAQSDATGAIEKSKNKKSNSLVMPVDKIHQSLVKVFFLKIIFICNKGSMQMKTLVKKRDRRKRKRFLSCEIDSFSL